MELAIALLALTAMEIVLGIDNIVFITIVSAKLPKEQQPLARRLGLALALITRLALLFALYFLVHGEQFQSPVFDLTDLGVPPSLIERLSVTDTSTASHLSSEILANVNQGHFDESNGVSWKDLILFLGGLFLVGKSVYEIHDEFGHVAEHEVKPSGKAFAGVLLQIALLDVVFSIDSVITAVGMVEDMRVMVAAIILAVIVMLIFAESVSRFVENHPTVKILALSFLILIGVMLVAEGVGAHMDKGYIYFAMFFALLVEVMNIALRSKQPPPVSENPAG
ncbi:MAG: putative tellurium resistance membrane protein TerC [Mariniblastus sp.]|jgi:predicted tellurium resistance membrane protein TerC